MNVCSKEIKTSRIQYAGICSLQSITKRSIVVKCVISFNLVLPQLNNNDYSLYVQLKTVESLIRYVEYNQV